MASEHRMDDLLAVLKAAAEPTRLRILALLSEGELSVGELTSILGQSQPRVSRHLKLLSEAGLLERLPEGSSVYYDVARNGDRAAFLRRLDELLPADDPALEHDRLRRREVVGERAAIASAYFRKNAERWDEIRSLYVDEAEVEAALLKALPPERVHELLDIGTGTGRILALFASRGVRAVGIDLSREMLAVARANLARDGLGTCRVQQGDMYQLPWPAAAFDAITLHQVLHFAERPAAAITEAARVLRPGGRLLVADFAPHDLEFLRTAHAHHRLGFAADEVAGWAAAAGLVPQPVEQLPGGRLTVSIWVADRPPAPASH